MLAPTADPRHRRRPLPCAGLLAVAALTVLAADDYDTVLYIGFDNDVFADNDDYYSNGFFLGLGWRGGWARPQPELVAAGVPVVVADGPDLLGFLPGIGGVDGRRDYSLILTHRVFTPGDIEQAGLIEDDLPYSGQLLLSGSVSALDERRLHAWTVTVGVVGPSSGAEGLQTWYHDLLDQTDPAGWEHQLRDEVVAALLLQNRYRICRGAGERWGGDLIASANGALGTLVSYVDVGIGTRLGLHLPDNFRLPGPLYGDPSIGLGPLTPDDRVAWYLLIHVAGSVIGNNIAWDGNTYVDSHSVAHEHWNLRANAGLVLETRHVILAAEFAVVTIPWDNPDDKETDAFGGLSFAFTF